MPDIDQVRQETFALRLSLVGSILMAVLGIGFALYTQSEAIMLDGLFSLVTFVMSLLTLKVSSLLNKGGSAQFQFGYASFEPLLNTVKGLIILLLSVYAFFSSVGALLHGGRHLQMGAAVVYSLISTASCFGVAVLLKRYTRRLNSPLLQVDVDNWMVDGMISAGVALTFVTALLISQTRWSGYVAYIDPILVCVIVLSVLYIPIKTVWQGINELLGASPDLVLESDVRQRLQVVSDEFAFQRTQVRMLLQGRLLYILLRVLVSSDSTVDSTSELDQVRQRYRAAIEGLHPGLAMDVLFTKNQDWK